MNGNVFFDVEFRRKDKVVSVSYENVEAHLEVIVFNLSNGKMPDYDDKTGTFHLQQLNRLLMHKVDKEEIRSNAEYFSDYTPKDPLEKQLLKGAKELRLCLKHFHEL